MNSKFLVNFTTLVLAAPLLVGCGALPKKPTSSYSLQRLAVPEVAAEPLKVGLQVGIADMHKVILPDTANASPDYNCDKIINCVVDDSTFTHADITVMQGLAFNYNTQLNRIGATWQFYGDYASASKAGNFSQALVFGYSRDKESESDLSVEGEILTEFNPRSWQQSTDSLDIGWVGGYRVADQWLVYGGPFAIFHTIDNSVQLEKQLNADIISMENNFQFKGRQIGANIALRFEATSWLNFDIEFVSSQYRMNQQSNRDSQFNFAVATRF